MEQPDTYYVDSNGVNVAYQVVGSEPLDMVFIPGTISHLDLLWTHPSWVNFVERLTSFARVAFYDKAGTGLSDPLPGPVTPDQRMDDVLAVMGAVGMERATVFGFSEGAAIAAVFAAAHPDRVNALITFGGFAHIDPDAPETAQIIRAFERWGEGELVRLLAPSLWSNAVAKRLLATFERASASPQMAQALLRSNMLIDVRSILASVQVPTLVLHRRDEFVPLQRSLELADGIPNAKFVELGGVDHAPWLGDVDSVVDEVEEFLTGTRQAPNLERTLATVLFSDIVDSTKRNAEVGDAAWRRQMSSHDSIVREALARHRGLEVKTTGDGFLARFDGPARALGCARSIVENVPSSGVDIKIGIHTGEVDVLDHGDVGEMAVNIGARIGAMASANEYSSRRR